MPNRLIGWLLPALIAPLALAAAFEQGRQIAGGRAVLPRRERPAVNRAGA